MWLFEILKKTVEFQNIGWNAISLSFVATTLLSALQIIAAWQQNKLIKKRRSSKSWTVTMFAYLCFYCLTFIFYGAHRNSLALVFSGIPGLFYIPIIINVWKYKQISKTDIMASFILFLFLPFMIWSEQKGLVHLLMFAIGAMSMLLQAYKMIKNNNYGDVDPLFLFSFFISSLFWFIYALAIKDQAVQASSGLSAVFVTIMSVLYYNWRKKRP